MCGPASFLSAFAAMSLCDLQRGRGHALAGRQHEPAGVLLGGDHDQRAPVELAGGLGTVDELPQPGDRGPWAAVLAVVDTQPPARAVLAGLGDVGAQLVDDEADA